MIHLYQNNGYNIVLDVNSGAVHVVDKAAYDVIGALEEQNELHTAETLKTPETFEFLRSKLRRRYKRYFGSCRNDYARGKTFYERCL